MHICDMVAVKPNKPEPKPSGIIHTRKESRNTERTHACLMSSNTEHQLPKVHARLFLMYTSIHPCMLKSRACSPLLFLNTPAPLPHLDDHPSHRYYARLAKKRKKPQTNHLRLTPIKLKNSFLVFSLRSKHPKTQLVIVVVLVFSTPLITMHK